MVAYVADRVCETSTSTGTGNITVAGAITGFRSFSDSGISGGGSAFYYLIEDVDAGGAASGDWEVGVGHFSASTTLVRDVTLQSSNSGSAVDFAAGTKRVHATASAMELMWVGARTYFSSNLTAQNLTTATAISWDGTDPEIEPTGTGFYNSGTPTQLIIPAVGYDQCKVELLAQVSLASITVADWVELKILYAGSPIARQTFYVPTTTPCFQIASPVTQVGFSDTFTVTVKVGADTSVDIIAADTWFQINLVM